VSAEIELVAEAPLPTRHGTFRTCVFVEPAARTVEHVALVRGNVAGDGVLCRVHSECLTGEIFGSLKCECGPQLDRALERIAREGSGVLVYLRQEGRGIGLANKVRAYALQARGFDTVDANLALDLPEDARCYDAAAGILRHFGVGSVRLLTNNPHKVEALGSLGIPVRERLPHVVAAHPLSHAYLSTKRRKMQHLIPLDSGEMP
jgi:GTP cyclohydrolase II